MAANPDANLGFQNFFQATLTGDITASSTDILMDNIPNSSQGFLVIEPDSTTNREVIFYTSKTALKVVCPSAADGRGQDDTTAVAHSTGAVVIMPPVAAFFEALQSGQSLSDDSIASRHVVGFDKSNLTTDSNPYKFRAYLNQSQSHTNGVFVKMNLNAEDFDTNNNFDATTNYRYTAPVNGFYFFSGAARTNSSSSAGLCIAELRKNGTSITQGTQYGNASGFGRPTVTDFVQLTAGDYIELYARWDVASTTIAQGSNETYLTGFLVSRT